MLVADPGFANGGSKVERRRREDRARRLRRRGGWDVRRDAPPQIFFFTLDLKMSTSNAFWALFLQFSCKQAKTLLLGLQNLLLQSACTALTAKGGKHKPVAKYSVSQKSSPPP